MGDNPFDQFGQVKANLCSGCGKTIDEYDKYCSRCGMAVASREVDEQRRDTTKQRLNESLRFRNEMLSLKEMSDTIIENDLLRLESIRKLVKERKRHLAATERKFICGVCDEFTPISKLKECPSCNNSFICHSCINSGEDYCKECYLPPGTKIMITGIDYDDDVFQVMTGYKKTELLFVNCMVGGSGIKRDAVRDFWFGNIVPLEGTCINRVVDLGNFKMSTYCL